MNYYEVRSKQTGELLAKGNAVECKRALGCASLDSFYALANRSLRGANGLYDVVKMKGSETDYPVLGKADPMYKKYYGIEEPTNGEMP